MLVKNFFYICFGLFFSGQDIIGSAQSKKSIVKSLSLSSLDNKASYGAVIQDEIPCCFAVQSVQPEFLLKEIKIPLAYEVPIVQGYEVLESRPTNYRMPNRRESMIAAIRVPHDHDLSSSKDFCYCLLAGCSLVAAECCCCRN